MKTLAEFAPPRVDYRLASGITIPDMHADDVREVTGVLETYLSTPNTSVMDAVAHALVQWRVCRERRIVQERAAARRREIARGIR